MQGDDGDEDDGAAGEEISVVCVSGHCVDQLPERDPTVAVPLPAEQLLANPPDNPNECACVFTVWTR